MDENARKKTIQFSLENSENEIQSPNKIITTKKEKQETPDRMKAVVRRALWEAGGQKGEVQKNGKRGL